MPPTTAYIALGSNLGDRESNLRLALAHLRSIDGIELSRVSSFLENPAVGGPATSPPFLNAAAEVQTALAPADLLSTLLAVEKELGRVRREKWEPRVIDLDLLLYADEVIRSDGLIVPHPLMHERQFVLQPLSEIAPNVMHPTLGATISSLLEQLALAPDHNSR